jgi:hypothetical protein
MVAQSLHLQVPSLERLTSAWIPNVVIIQMIDGSGGIDAPLAHFAVQKSSKHPSFQHPSFIIRLTL